MTPPARARGTNAVPDATAPHADGLAPHGASARPSIAARTALYAGCSFVSLVVLEHAARVLGLEHRPQTLLDAASDYARALFTWLGALFAYASSFLERLRFDELLATIGDILMSVAKLVTTPLWVVYGYTHEVLSAAHPWVIWIGSALIAGSLLYAARAHLARTGAWLAKHWDVVAWCALLAAVLYWLTWDVSLLELVAPRLRATLKAL